MNSRNNAVGTIAIVWLLSWMVTAAPAVAQITADQVRESIERGVDFIKQERDDRSGGWPDAHQQPGGVTALCTLALLNAGLPVDDPAVAGGLEYLRKIGNPKKVYATSLQTMVFCLAEPRT